MAIVLNATYGSPDANSYVTVAEAGTYFEELYGFGDWAGLEDTAKMQLLIMASRQIDSLRYRGKPVFVRNGYIGREQALKFPNREFDVVVHTQPDVELSTATKIVCSALTGDWYVDDFFNHGSIAFSEGAQEGQIRAVSDFVLSTGALTCDAFESAPEAGNSVVVVGPAPSWLKYAVYAQAWHLYLHEGGHDPSLANQNNGVASWQLPGGLSESFQGGRSAREVRYRGNIYIEAYNLVKGYLDRSVELVSYA